MKKRDRNLLLLLLAIGIIFFGTQYNLFSIVDDYITYYAFDGSSPAVQSILSRPYYTPVSQRPANCIVETWGGSGYTNYRTTCYDDKMNITVMETNPSGTSSSVAEVRDDYEGYPEAFHIGGNSNGGTVTYKLNQDMKGNYFKISFHLFAGCGYQSNIAFRFDAWDDTNDYGVIGCGYGSAGIQRDILIEVTPSSLDKDLVYVSVNGGDPVEKRIATPKWYPEMSFGGLNGWVVPSSSVKYKPFFGCEKNMNEVVVRDKFASGTVYDIEDLTYKPSKICLALTPKIVSDSGVATDRFGEILSKLARGQEVSVAEGTYQIVDYITYYVNDMTERCDLNTVYNTETKNCETSETQIDTKDILSCSSSSDCLIPTKCTATPTCSSGTCKYTSPDCSDAQVLNEVIVYKQMINDVIAYRQAQTDVNEYVGNGRFTFTTGCTTQGQSGEICLDKCFSIGDAQFCGAIPEFACSLKAEDQASTNYDQQPDNCWKNTVTFAGASVSLTKGVKTKLSDWLSVTWYPSGKGVRNNAVALPYSSGYIFDINVKDFIDISNVKEQNIFTLLNAPKSAVYTVVNNMANFGASQSGFRLVTEPTLLQQAPTTTFPAVAFNKGTNSYTITVPTDQIGTLVLSANPYIKIKADKQMTFYDDQTSFFAYNVVQEIPKNTACVADITFKCKSGMTITIVKCNDGQIVYTNQECVDLFPTMSEGLTFSNVAPYVAIGIIVIGGFLFIKRKRR